LENLIQADEIAAASKKSAKTRHLSALILAPTRELVMQIHNEFKNVARFTNYKSVAVIGGLSEEKQERLLNKNPHVIIATPGRYWSLVRLKFTC
jgi:ATP-dependent RNA helicase DDX24/MAK5